MALTPFFGYRGNRSDRSLWDPFSSVFDPWDINFGDRFFGRDFGQSGVGAVANTRVDWVETPEAHVFKADLPGLSKEDIKVEVEGRTLSIRGERTKEETHEKDNWRSVERSYGQFSRQFALPENAKVDEVSAKVDHGVLTVTVPKKEVQPSQVRAIDVA